MGRNIPLSKIENIAQGRVWTGKQAVEIGLVNELGGMNRAIAYAKKQFTSGEAVVEVWPNPLTLKKIAAKLLSYNNIDAVDFITMFWNEFMLNYISRECMGAQDARFHILKSFSEGESGLYPCQTFTHPDLLAHVSPGYPQTCHSNEQKFGGLWGLPVQDLFPLILLKH